MANQPLPVYALRQRVLDMVYQAKAGHIGGDFSVLDILAVLYLRHMRVSPQQPQDPDRDYFILSKGHSVEAYYAVLAQAGFLTQADLESYGRLGSPLMGHPNNHVPGIEMNTGSLGHGLPVCVGLALGCQMDRRPNRVYTVMGDGELAEGSVWEAAMAAGHYKLDHLCAIIDRNGLQISGPTEKVMGHEDLHRRWESFGWNVLEVPDGNDTDQLEAALALARAARGKPSLLIAHTVKGFGVSFMENVPEWHHRVPTETEYRQAREELGRRGETRL